MPELTLQEPGHIYRADGVIVPSVTQVLSDVGIIDYSMIPAEDRERYLQRGKDVHVATHYDDEGDLDEAAFDENLRGYLEAWRKFRAETGFVPALIEYRGFHSIYRYAGTLDRTGSWKGQAKILLDLKSGDLPWWTTTQLAAYAAFFDSPGSFRRVGVELHDDGTYRVQEFRCKDFLADFQVFQAALAIFNEKRRHDARSKRSGP